MTDVVWSYGGGVQSVAIAVLVAEGRLPMPDHIVIADTGRETRLTREYMHDHVEPMLGRTIDIIPHEAARVDLYDPKGRLLIPAWTDNPEGKGRLPTYCSAEWKRDVIARWMRQKGYGPKNPVAVWLGISTDEVHRAKQPRQQFVTNHFPLMFDVPLGRAECLLLAEKHGLPRPPRSACWMCPHRSDESWRALPADEMQAAIEFEREVRAKDAHFYLHRSLAPLESVDMTDERMGLFDECDEGYCFV